MEGDALAGRVGEALEERRAGSRWTMGGGGEGGRWSGVGWCVLVEVVGSSARVGAWCWAEHPRAYQGEQEPGQGPGPETSRSCGQNRPTSMRSWPIPASSPLPLSLSRLTSPIAQASLSQAPLAWPHPPSMASTHPPRPTPAAAAAASSSPPRSAPSPCGSMPTPRASTQPVPPPCPPS